MNHESDFLKDKIQEKDPSAKVTFIPKSLYQLFVWNLYLKEVAENPGNCLGIGRLENIPWNNKYNYGKKELIREEWFKYRGDDPFCVTFRSFVKHVISIVFSKHPKQKGIALGIKCEHPKDIFEFCRDYINNENVQSYFWKINDSIIDYVSKHSSKEYNFENLKGITKSLLEDLTPNVEIYLDKNGYDTPNLLANELLKEKKYSKPLLILLQKKRKLLKTLIESTEEKV